MPRLDPDTVVLIETEPDGRFTLKVRFNGAIGPRSRPMVSREDAGLLGNTLITGLERQFRQRTPLEEMNRGDRI